MLPYVPEPERPIQTIAVIGAGEVARAFAIRCGEAGFDIFLEDVMPSKLRAAKQEFASAGSPVNHRLRLVSTVEDAVRDADLAIDFVPDELESKLEIFSLLDRMAPPKTILCTPTQSLSIADLASCTYRPAQCVALESFRSTSAGEEVRLVRGRTTSAATSTRVAAVIVALGYSVRLAEDERDPLLAANHRAARPPGLL